MSLRKTALSWTLLSLTFFPTLTGHFSEACADELFPVENVFVSIARPEVTAMGVDLAIVHDIESPDYYGGCSLNRPHYVISIGSDVIHKPNMTQDAYAAVLCHELGHLLGGAPRKAESSWASTEGQSDYYAASMCMKKMMRAMPQEPADLAKQSIAATQKTHTLCAEKYSVETSREICSRTILAGLGFLTDVYELVQYPGLLQPSLDQHEKPLTSGQIVNYPSLQCRLDTFVAGALGEPRPACWFLK